VIGLDQLMNIRICAILVFLSFGSVGFAQGNMSGKFDRARADLETQLKDSMAELTKLRETIAGEKIPLSKKLGELESELSQVRQQYQDTTRELDSQNLDISNLRRKIKGKNEEASYLSNLLSDYMRGFEAKLHIAELKRFSIDLKAAKSAIEDENMEERKLFMSQVGLVNLSIERLEDALGGDVFTGHAVNEDGVVKKGAFAVIGPVAVFRSADGRSIGMSEQRLGSLEPSALPFRKLENTMAVSNLVLSREGVIPFDPTMGNAHKIENTEETLLEHVQKGGAVMYPIFGMAAVALLIAAFKWLSFLFIRKPSRRRTKKLLETVAAGDIEGAEEQAKKFKGPMGRMLAAGVAHLREPKELIEEVMYESILRAEAKLQSLLPFVGVCAASAPLLGLLGTVTGIISTFKMIEVFGSGDVKSLSGGISEALITTKFGLIVAIPSLLLHAFLSRKAKRLTNEMETNAIAFVNRASVGGSTVEDKEGSSREIKQTVTDVLRELLGPEPVEVATGVEAS
jgi:biopolymer transport protein ExbB